MSVLVETLGKPVILGDPLIIARTPHSDGETPQEAYIRICDQEGGFPSQVKELGKGLALGANTVANIAIFAGSMLSNRDNENIVGLRISGMTAALVGLFATHAYLINAHPAPDPLYDRYVCS